MKLDRLVPLAALALLSGCGDPPKPTKAIEPVQWSKLQDGSSFARVKTDDAGVYSDRAHRCWDDGGSKLCITASSVRAGSSANFIHIGLYRTEKLLTDLNASGLRESAYFCDSFTEGDTADEQIWSQSGKLTSNLVSSFNQSPWSKGFVEGFLKSNSLPTDPGYFDCPQIVDALRAGSIASIGSSAISRDVLAEEGE